MLDLTYQVSLCRHTNKDQVVSDADFLSLRSLLGRRVDGPPAGLSYWHKYTKTDDNPDSSLLLKVTYIRGEKYKNYGKLKEQLKYCFDLINGLKRFCSSNVKCSKEHRTQLQYFTHGYWFHFKVRSTWNGLSGGLNSIKSSKKPSELCKVPVSHTVPIESSCSPTSNDSLSVRDLDVFKQVRYWWVKNELLSKAILRQAKTRNQLLFKYLIRDLETYI